MEMLTRIDIPKTDRAIYAHNSREELAAKVFVNNMRLCAEAALEGYNWAMDVIERGCISDEAKDLNARASVFYQMDMMEKTFSSVDIAAAIREIYNEMKEAKDNEIQNEGTDTADTNIGQ